MLHSTFRKAREDGACIESYRKMAKALGGIKKYGLDTSIPLDKVLDICGLDDALWALRIVIEPADREIRLFACDCAEHVLPFFEKRYPDDKRPRQAIEVARRFANGQATQEELIAADSAAWSAVSAAGSPARSAAKSAAMSATWSVAWSVAWLAAWLAAGSVEREWQKQRFLELLSA